MFCNNTGFFAADVSMITSVPMDECQSSHIKNIMTRLTTIKCDTMVPKQVNCYSYMLNQGEIIHPLTRLI